MLIFQHPLTTIQWTGAGLVFAGLFLDSAFGKSDKHKTTSQKNDVDGNIDKMVNNGYVSEHDTLQQTHDKLKPM